MVNLNKLRKGLSMRFLVTVGYALFTIFWYVEKFDIWQHFITGGFGYRKIYLPFIRPR